MSHVSQAVIVVAPARGDPRREVGGLTLIERLLRERSEIRTVQEILVLASPGPPLPALSARVSKPVRTVGVAPGDAWSMVRSPKGMLQERVLVVAGGLLVDPPILASLTTRTEDTLRRELATPRQYP